MRYFIDNKEVSEEAFKVAIDNELRKIHESKDCYNMFLDGASSCALVYFKNGVPYRYFLETW